MQWNAKFGICGFSAFLSLALFSNKLHQWLVIPNNVGCTAVATVCIFHRTSIPALKCEVHKLWYISSLWRLANLSKMCTTDWGFCRLQHVQYTGQSPVFRNRGGQKPEGGAINQKGGTFWIYSIECMQQPVGQNVKWGAGHHWSPAGDDLDSTQISPYQHFCTDMRISQSVVSRLFEGCILIRIQ